MDHGTEDTTEDRREDKTENERGEQTWTGRYKLGKIPQKKRKKVRWTIGEISLT